MQQIDFWALVPLVVVNFVQSCGILGNRNGAYCQMLTPVNFTLRGGILYGLH